MRGKFALTGWRLIWALPLIAAAQMSSACPGHAAEWDDVVAAAKREGKLVVYVGAPTTPKEIGAIVEKRYGIPVEMLFGRASEIRERIRTEQASGRPIADVLISGATTVGPVVEGGGGQPHGGIPNTTRLVAPFRDNGTILPLSVTRFTLLVNSDLVKPGSEPASWTDLLDPKWKGKILSDDPRAAGGGNGALAVLYERYGRDYAERYAAQAPTFSREILVNERRVARGEFPIMFPFNSQNLAQLQGLPVRLVAPRDGIPFITIEVTRLKDAPHPNAARVLMNEVLGAEYQGVIADRGYGSPVGARSEKLPPELSSLDQATLMGQADFRKSDEMLKVFEEIFK